MCNPPPSRFLLCSPVTMMAAVTCRYLRRTRQSWYCEETARSMQGCDCSVSQCHFPRHDTELVSVHSMCGSSLVPRPPMWPGNKPWGPSVTTVLFTNLIQTVSVFLYMKHEWHTFSGSVIIANLYVFSSALLYWFQNILAISKIALY